MAAIMGTPSPSNFAQSSRYSASLGGPENSLMSAPVKKLLPAQRSNTARTFLSAARVSRASRMPARAAAVMVLTGGLSTTMTAMSS